MQASDLRHRMIAAVPVPFDDRGRIDRAAQCGYAAHLAATGVGGVAVWAHTGRGLRLSAEQRGDVLRDWKATLGGRAVLIAGAGSPPHVTGPQDAINGARAMADLAADLGADALLVHPPSFVGGRPDGDRLVLDYHEEIARSGLPLILFYLYAGAGGVAYSREILGELLGRPEVLGIKVATLDGVMTFQDLARLVRQSYPEKVLISGEDRFLGYSLMAGAEGALIGMGSACTVLQNDLLQSYWKGDHERFLALNGLVDELGQATFLAPMDGYIQRMLWCLVHEGVLSRGSAHDPWAPSLPSDEFDRVGRALDRLRAR